MKLTINSSANPIRGATQKGTVFYKITEEELVNFYDTYEDNDVFRYLVQVYGFQTFDIDKLYGSYLDSNANTLYLCVTDGEDIQVGVDSDVYPEDAFYEYSEEELQSYIQPATDEIIKRYLSPYEISLPVSINQIALDMLEEDYSFVSIVQGMKDLDLLDDII